MSLTTDGDSKSFEGLKTIQKKYRPEIKPVNLRHTRHFSESQKREIEKILGGCLNVYSTCRPIHSLN